MLFYAFKMAVATVFLCKNAVEAVIFRPYSTVVSQEILNCHSLRHSHSAEICIHFYCLS